MKFQSRADAGRRLAARLWPCHEDAIVLGVPCGGIPVAAEVARVLCLPLDVVVVRKLGLPDEPELAMGVIGEDGIRVINDHILKGNGVDRVVLAAVEAREQAALRRRVALFRAQRPQLPLAGRVALVVDDGIATAATARVACLAARHRGARKVILAAPVAPRGVRRLVDDISDEVVCARLVWPLKGVGQEYRNFVKVTDAQALLWLARSDLAWSGRAW